MMSLSHRMSHTATYRTWGRMIQRCTNPNIERYPHYGGRGISVCARWMSFQHFLEDMGERPTDSHSLDRIDPNGDYEPGNCRWATAKEQARNRTDSFMVTAYGAKKSVKDWEFETGVQATTIRARIEKLNWSPEAAVCSPSSHSLTRYRGGTLRDFRSIKKLGREPINDAPKVTVTK